MYMSEEYATFCLRCAGGGFVGGPHEHNPMWEYL